MVVDKEKKPQCQGFWRLREVIRVATPSPVLIFLGFTLAINPRYSVHSKHAFLVFFFLVKSFPDEWIQISATPSMFFVYLNYKRILACRQTVSFMIIYQRSISLTLLYCNRPDRQNAEWENCFTPWVFPNTYLLNIFSQLCFISVSMLRH